MSNWSAYQMTTMKYRFLLFIPAMTMFLLASGQDRDTLGMVRMMLEQGEVKPAMALIKEYHETHPADPEATGLFARAAYWSGDLKQADRLYQLLMLMNDASLSLRLDYAGMLTETGRLREAEAILQAMIEQDPRNQWAWFAMAKNLFYAGELQKATGALHHAIIQEPDNVFFHSLKTQIATAGSPVLAMELESRWDDQPLQANQVRLRIEKRHSQLFNPSLGLEMHLLESDTLQHHLSRLHFGNDFRMFKYGILLSLGGGLMTGTGTGSDVEWSADMKAGMRIWRHLGMNLLWQRNPYLYTISSLSSHIMEHHAGVNVRWDNPDHWNGELHAGRRTYPGDKNKILSMAGWFFLPSLNLGNWHFSAGYGYSRANADSSRFTSTQSIPQILASGLYLTSINGIYQPYFTPRSQQVHALLGNIRYASSGRSAFQFTFNYGLWAQSSYPYLYLNRDSGSNLVISTGFQPERYHPAELRLRYTYAATGSVSASAEAHYQSTLFYSSVDAKLTIRYRL